MMNKLQRLNLRVSRFNLRLMSFSFSLETSSSVGKMLCGGARWFADKRKGRTAGASLRDYCRKEQEKPTTIRHRLIGAGALMTGYLVAMTLGQKASSALSSNLGGTLGFIASMPFDMVVGYSFLSLGAPSFVFALNVTDGLRNGLEKIERSFQKKPENQNEPTKASTFAIGDSFEREFGCKPSFASMIDQITQKLEADQDKSDKGQTASKKTPVVQSGIVPKNLGL